MKVVLVLLLVAVYRTDAADKIKCMVGAVGQATETVCTDASQTKCSGPKFVEYTGYTDIAYKCGKCTDAEKAKCEECDGKADKGCNVAKTVAADFNCKDWEYKDSKWTAKTTSTACKRLKDTAIMCNAPGSKADDKYAVKNKGCGKCVAADKTAGKCGECKTADCNTKVVDSSALSITALLLPLLATLYTLL